MAPLIINHPELQPHVHPRQQAAGPSPVSLSLTVVDVSTTYTTAIFIESSTTPITQVNIPASSTTSAAPTPLLIPATSSDSPDRGAIIGGVLGGFLGFFVLMAILWKCCYDNKSALHTSHSRSSYYGNGTDSTSSVDSGSERVRRRGGWGGHSRHGVRRPSRVYARRESSRRGSSNYDEWQRDDARRSKRYSRRTAGGLMYKNGVFGWPLGGITKPVYVETRERSRWSSSGKGDGYKYRERSPRFYGGDD